MRSKRRKEGERYVLLTGKVASTMTLVGEGMNTPLTLRPSLRATMSGATGREEGSKTKQLTGFF